MNVHIQAVTPRSYVSIYAIFRKMPGLRQCSGSRLLHLSSGRESVSQARQRLFGAVVRENQSSVENRRPVVALLGWNGSMEKHLRKYSEIFEAKNYDTICVPANPFNTFLRSGTKVKQIGFHILDILLELNCQHRPVFLYAFSNGGCAVFFHIMEALTTSKHHYYQAVPVVGTMFDSCPISPDVKSLRATQDSVTEFIKHPLLKPIVFYTLGVVIPLVIYFNSTVKRFMTGLVESPLQCPQLLLYSKSDQFAPYGVIDWYAQARSEKGIKVVAKCWESSKHVNHYREHTEEYLSLVHSFMEDCLVAYSNIEETKSE